MITIRHASKEDLQKVRELNNKIFARNPEYDADAVLNFALTPMGGKYFEDAMGTQDGCFFIAEDGNSMIGYTNGTPLDFPYRKSKYFEIHNLGVIPERKRQGIGKMLLTKIEQWAREHGFDKVYLNSYIKNNEALEFYRKNGYKDIDICLERKI